NSRSCMTRRSLAWVSRGMLPISSKKSVPLSASSKRPFFEYTAPVKAPLTCPKRFDSRRSCGNDPELTTMKGLSALEEFVWMALATSSLPVPLSPTTRMVERLFVLEGLGDVVEGPPLHGLDGRLHGGEGSDHEDDEIAVHLLQLLEDV